MSEMQAESAGAPPPTAEASRQARVLAAARAWTDQLVDVSGRNSLLYFKDLRAGTLDLTVSAGATSETLAALVEGRTVRLSRLFAEPATLADASHRARTIRAKAQENFEERGLSTLMVGWGMATWHNPRSAAMPAAPVLLRNAVLAPKGGAAEDFDLHLVDEWEVNPTLLHLLRTEHGVEIDDETLLALLDPGPAAEGDPDVAPTAVPAGARVWERLETAADVSGFAVGHRLVLGNFSYAKLPMVQDIEAAAASGLLEAHDLLAAIAGDDDARVAVRNRRAEVPIDEPDRISPAEEFLVVDADASQSHAINTVVAGAHLVVEGPPGTGKSQTIANLIATLAARRQRVLFVAEKRAAIDAVIQRLERAGLGDLVLDLHGGPGSRRQLSQDLAKAMADHASVPLPDLSDDHQRLLRRRETLVSRTRALHEVRQPWNLSVFDVQSRLLALPAGAASAVRFSGDVLAGLDDVAMAVARDMLRAYIELGGMTLAATSTTPWAPAFRAGTITTQDLAAAALQATGTTTRISLPAVTAQLGQLAATCGLRPSPTIAGWAEVFSLLEGVGTTLGQCEPAIYDAALPELLADLQPATAGRASRLIARLTSGDYRQATRTARALLRPGTPKPAPAALRQLLATASSQRSAWEARATDGGRPRLPDGLAEVAAGYHRLVDELTAIGGYAGHPGLVALEPAEITAHLQALLDDQVTLFKLPELSRLWAELYRRGTGEVVADAGNRALDPDRAAAALDHAWLTSILEAVSVADPAIGAFDGAAQNRVVADYNDADRRHVGSGAQRVRRAVAEWAVQTRDLHPQQSDVVERQARLKRKHLPVRQLFQAAPDVLGAMKPCWAMSPLVVAQLLPPTQCFDVVIFDEASQVTPADAVGALLRADRAVVAGDTRQLPPTTFFTAAGHDERDSDGGPDESSALTTGLESVLDVMAALLPAPWGTRTLGWHYRSRDERLIAFSNAQPTLYDWSLTTFPGVAGGDCLRHVLVPFDLAGRVAPEGSAPDEVRRVVELVLEHAALRPQESLGVIAMGLPHAERITEAIRRARGEHPHLDQWFEQGPEEAPGHEPFFVKNLERVQGDERDAVILTVGYGKGADGRMLYRFGPLNAEGGQRRLNVAITRARNRMTVVSSFSSADLDPSKLRAEGAQMLGRYLAYAESGGTNLGDAAKAKPVPTPFEHDLRHHLSEAGIPLVPQFGASGAWIDVAVQHPTHPGRMVLAIECDGPGYRSAATTRDRDRLRRDQLQRLGWRFHRVWSTDWFRNRGAEVARALAAWQNAVVTADALDAGLAAQVRAAAITEAAGLADTPSPASRPAPAGRAMLTPTVPGTTPSLNPPGVRTPSGQTPAIRNPSGRWPAVRLPSGPTPPVRLPSGQPPVPSSSPVPPAPAGSPATAGSPESTAPTGQPDSTAPARSRGPRPALAPRGTPIEGHPPADLEALVRWIESDTLLRTEDELLDAAMEELGYQRRGPRIVASLTAAIRAVRTA